MIGRCSPCPGMRRAGPGSPRSATGAVFGNDAGRVLRLDGAGRVLWTVETGGEIELPLVVTEDGVVGAVTAGDTLVALDAETGHERWRASGQPQVAALAAVGNRLVLLGREGELRAFPARDGGMPVRRGWNTSLGLRPRTPPRGLVAIGGDVLAEGPAAVLLLSSRGRRPALEGAGPRAHRRRARRRPDLDRRAIRAPDRPRPAVGRTASGRPARAACRLGPQRGARPRLGGAGGSLAGRDRRPRRAAALARRRSRRCCWAAWSSGRTGRSSPPPGGRAGSWPSTSSARGHRRARGWTARSAPRRWSGEAWPGCSPPMAASSGFASVSAGRRRAGRQAPPARPR